VATFDDLTDPQVTQLLAQAQNTFESWSQKSFDERAAVCRRAAAILRERADEFARLLTLEMGKLYAESLGEAELSAEIFEYYAENAEAFLAPEPLDTASSDDNAVVVSAPLGVILGIQPWNFPYYQPVRVAAPNLMGGNVVMVKHASNVPQAAAAFERLLAEAGAPQGAHSNLYATKDQLLLLIDDPRVHGVALTGSEGAGAVVAARAGKNLKKSTMELGGSDALIALADADVDKTVAWARHGRIFNGGQCCVASKRIIVVDDIADKFLDRFQVVLSELNAGDPFDASTTLPPMSSQGAADDLNEQITAAVEAGAKAIPCGEPLPTTGAFVQPTILTDITPDNPAQEFFGPVALFFRVKDEDESRAAGQRFALRAGWIGVHAGRRARGRGGQADRHRHGVHQPPHAAQGRPAVRRGQDLGLRPRTRQPRHSGVREQEAHQRRPDRRTGLTNTPLNIKEQ
jgi:succinate-semialdehyde dehydrogenase/glutarate-semialdehyde dehydrogenase